ncbi:hypothetical protein tinsulaeT_24250 [Thalassotalea insulae]|uniref:PKD domain-containing protein n=1 Tax=Thalassotalea insulae TaxID=2056778 RepID=A0ABQ6GWH7_9GAMM|nr:PKD domain-containing protein [Thalassotalea insulae]GLX79085.1 hypothetical protein tinsulaeT_24250 [Thalassotalea insulae]
MINSISKLSYLSLCLLVVGCGSSSKDKVSEPTNSAPIAHITLEKNQVAENETITFSAEKSNDPNGDKITYQWRLIDANGQTLTLDDDQSQVIEYTPQNFGNYTIELSVQDDKSAASKITSQFTVTPSENDYPLAKIDAKSKAKVGAVHWFNGEQSRGAPGEQINFEWRLESKPDGSNATMQDTTQVKSYFIADQPGDYQVVMEVTNSVNQLSAISEFDLSVTTLSTNSEPVAAIRTEQREFSLNEVIMLDALNSYDADNDVLSYQWQMDEKPETSMAEVVISDEKFAQFNADVVGEYKVKLVVSDQETQNEKSVVIKVTDDNIAPVANAGVDFVSALNLPITLDASASNDPEGQPLVYEWSLLTLPENSDYEGVRHSISEDNVNFTFDPDVVGLYTWQLRVYDGLAYSAIDSVTIEVTENQKPVAILPESIVVNDADVVTIYGTESYDPEQQNLTYNWQFNTTPEEYDGEISHVNDQATFFPTKLGTYTVQLIVNDGIQDSVPVSMVVERQESPTYTREISGRLVDGGGKPIVNAQVGGILQRRSSTDENGDFSLTFSSRNLGASLSYLTFNIDGKILGWTRLGDYAETPLDAGDIKLPVMQRKDISLNACDGYSGPDTTTITFHQLSTGYENTRFLKATYAELTIGEEPVQVLLPATAELSLSEFQHHLTVVEAESGLATFTNTYQLDDTQQDRLTLTICN